VVAQRKTTRAGIAGSNVREHLRVVCRLSDAAL
jgi:hypothetical protein